MDKLMRVAFLLIFLLFNEILSHELDSRKSEERSKSSPGDPVLLQESSLEKANFFEETKDEKNLAGGTTQSGSRVKIRRWHPPRRKKQSLSKRKAVMEDHKARMGARYRLPQKRRKSSLEYTTINAEDRNGTLIKESRQEETSNNVRKSRGISSSTELEETYSKLSQSKNFRRVVPSRVERLAQSMNNLSSGRRALFGVANKVQPIITRRRKGKRRKLNSSDKEDSNPTINTSINSILDRDENTEFPTYDEMHNPEPPRRRFTPSPNRFSGLKSEIENSSNIKFTTATATKDQVIKNIIPSLTPKIVQMSPNTQNESPLTVTTSPQGFLTKNQKVSNIFEESSKTDSQLTASQQHLTTITSTTEKEILSSRSPSSDPDYDFYYDYEDTDDKKVSADSELQKPFRYGYKVNAKESGNFHSRTEQGNGKEVVGSYEVALPDGRIQIVSYIADDDGFRAEVTYKEKTKIPAKSSVEEPHIIREEKIKISTTSNNKNELVTQSPNSINAIVHNVPSLSFPFGNSVFPQVTPLTLTNRGTLSPNHLNLNTFGAKDTFPLNLDGENYVTPDPIGGLVTSIEPTLNSLTEFGLNGIRNIPQAPVYPDNSFGFPNRPLNSNEIFSNAIEPSPKPIPPPRNREVARIPPNPFIRNKHKTNHMPVKPRPKLLINNAPPIHPLLNPGKFNRPVTVAPPNPRGPGRRPFSQIHPNSRVPGRQPFSQIHPNSRVPGRQPFFQIHPNSGVPRGQSPFSQLHPNSRVPGGQSPFSQLHPNSRVPEGQLPFSQLHPNSVIQNTQGPDTGIHFPNIQFPPFQINNRFPNKNHLAHHFPSIPTSTEGPLLQPLPEFHSQTPQSKPESVFNTRPLKGRLDFNKIHRFPTTSPNPFKVIIGGTRTSRIQPTQKPIHTTTISIPNLNVHSTPTTTPHPHNIDQNFQVNQNLDYYDYSDYETNPYEGHIELLRTNTPTSIPHLRTTTPSPPTSFPVFSNPTSPFPFSPAPVFTTTLSPTTFRFGKPVTAKSHFALGNFPSNISPTDITSLTKPGLSQGSNDVFRVPRPHHFKAIIQSPKTNTIKDLFQTSLPKFQKPVFQSPKIKNLKESPTAKPLQPEHDKPLSNPVISKMIPIRTQLGILPLQNSVSTRPFTNRPFPTSNPISHVPPPSTRNFLPISSQIQQAPPLPTKNFFSNRPFPTTPSPTLFNRPFLTTPSPTPFNRQLPKTPSPTLFKLVLRKQVLNPISHPITPHIPPARKPVLFHYPFPNGTPSTPLLYNPNQKVVLQALGKTHSIPLLLPISGSASEKLEIVDKSKSGLSVLPDNNTTLVDRELIFSKSDIYPRHLPLSSKDIET